MRAKLKIAASRGDVVAQRLLTSPSGAAHEYRRLLSGRGVASRHPDLFQAVIHFGVHRTAFRSKMPVIRKLEHRGELLGRVLKAYASGDSQEQIANRLKCTIDTVRLWISTGSHLLFSLQPRDKAVFDRWKEVKRRHPDLFTPVYRLHATY